MPKRANFAAFIACFTALSACSLFVSIDGLSGGSAGDSGIPADGPAGDGSSDAGAGDGSAPDGSVVPDGNFLDDFNRPDNALIGNSWIEKRPSEFSLSNDEVMRADADIFDYPDNMVYRPPSEDVQDSTISIELTFTNGVFGFPQIHSRIQQDSIVTTGTVDSYLFYFNIGSPSAAIIARTRGFENLSDLADVSLTESLAVGERYRLTLKVSGRNPVSLSGTVEHLVSGSWVPIGQGSTLDTDPSQLDDAGSTGFSASTDDSNYLYDNFTRTSP